jgi:hypothetical protein
MSYTNKPKHLETDEANIQAITMVANQDWFEIIGHLVDETSEVDVNYSQLLLWQMYNSSKQSVMSFSLNAQYYKDKQMNSYQVERESTSGQEIAETNANYMVLQGKTWNALAEKFKSINEATIRLYEQLYQQHPKDRKITKVSKGKMRTLSDMTPEEVQKIRQVNDQMFGY